MEIARDEINAKGGIAGHKIDLDVLDTQSNNGQVVSLIRQACGNAFAVLGPSMSFEAQVAFPVANAMHCPAISSSATATNLTDKNRPWTFSYASPASVITPQAVDLLIAKLKPKRAVVVIDRGDAAANDQGPLAEKTLQRQGRRDAGADDQRQRPGFRPGGDADRQLQAGFGGALDDG